jgi:hypothetical protein
MLITNIARPRGSIPLLALTVSVAIAAIGCQGSRPPSGPGTETQNEEAQVEESRMDVPVAFSEEPRRAKPRADLPEAIRPLLPERGIYAAGGGLTSSGWRIALSIDGSLEGGRAKGANKPSFGEMDDKVSKKIGGRDLAAVFALADEVWREKREPNLSPTADYDEIIAIVDGDEAFFLQGYGPIRGGSAADLIERLRALAGI